jgi:hypothetical protein
MPLRSGRQYLAQVIMAPGDSLQTRIADAAGIVTFSGST